ncbi:MAG: hypothetical protein ACYCTE_09495 [Acidimicrobiales bacterium]
MDAEPLGAEQLSHRPRDVERRGSENDAASIVAALRRLRCRFADEDQLQAMLADGLTQLGFDVKREVALARGGRIDLLVDRIGIEVKIAGQTSSVARQLRRYASSDLVDELVLATTCPRHAGAAPMIDRTPVHVVVLAGL